MGKMNQQQGYTLIELVTVSGIMTLLALTIVSMFLATLRGGNKAQLIQRLHQDGDFALKTISATVRNGVEISCTTGLSVVMPSGDTIDFSLVDDEGVSRIASQSNNFLTGKLANASNFIANCYQGYLGNQVVSLSFTLTAGEQAGAQQQEKFTRDFATSASTRSSQ
jgi:type II secretory pathway pseudopilin PulG